ncbi:hypothetical protein BJ166DRAFT_604128 [Pestalotiopsis sp. NC0098]|nr:hypothetical protein BJ166DRAFT_604128 [Pestalotiopsis sp. NC0098]
MSTLLETRAEAAARSETIFRKHVLLRRVLERHEATIGKRWQKKSRLQRLGILLAAWPDMPRTHRPDFAAFRSDHENIARAAPRGLREDSRWDEQQDALKWLAERRQFLPGEGLLVLEIQQRLLTFLVDVSQTILHDIPSEKLTSDEFSILPEPLSRTSEDATGLSNLGDLAMQAPYRPPAKIDLAKIESLLAAKVTRLEDHIWALREDPSYFSDLVFEKGDHRSEQIKDIRGHTHPALEPSEQELYRFRVTSNVVFTSLFQMQMYAELNRQAQQLVILARKYESQIVLTKELPGEYHTALLKFRFYLLRTVERTLQALDTISRASPPLRQFFAREPPEYDAPDMMTIMPSSTKRDNTTRYVLWLLNILGGDGEDLRICGLTTVTDELERLLRSDPKALGLISSLTAKIIGELSILKREQAIAKDFSQHNRVVEDTARAFDNGNKPGAPLGAWNLGNPSDGRFQYPLDKRRNKANTERLRTSEANLDAFWNAVDRMMAQKVPSLTRSTYKRFSTQPRRLERTPEWVEPVAKVNKKSTENAASQLVPQFHRLSHGPESSKSTRDQVLATSIGKPKVKRRGTPRVAEAEEADNQEVADEATRPTFKVDHRALRVFKILFFDSDATTTAGEVAWRDFLHAMNSVGFSAEKLYGSVWHFQPVRLDAKKSIQFHEPHPRGKIPFLVARRHGRRLNRTYGWEGNMFVAQ